MTEPLRSLDRDFARYCRSGDPGALAAVFDGSADELWRLARHLVGDRHAADDLVQEVFLVAIERRDRFEPGRPVLPWLLGILANLARRRRRRTTAGAPPARFSGTSGDDPVEAAARGELVRSLQRCVRGLPQPYRDVLVSHLEHGEGARAIAARRRCPPSTVRNQVMRGLDLLRRSLPAGLGSAAAVGTLSPRAAAALRDTVLRRAAAAAPVSPALTLTGAIVMHKITISAVVLAAVLLAWWVVSPPSAPPKERPAPVDGTGSAAADAGAGGVDTAASPGARDRVPQTPASTAPATSRASLSVRVHRDSEPVAAVGVYVRPVDGGPGAGQGGVGQGGVEQKTDAAGEVVFADLAPGPFRVVTDRGVGTEVSLRAGEQQRIELSLPRGLNVDGTVVDVEGKPVAGAGIFAKQRLHHDWFHQVATSDADGRFRLTEVAQGTRLLARAEHYQPSHHRRSGAVEGEIGADVAVRLRLGARAHRLRGVVRHADGRPAAGAVVAIAADEDARNHPDGVLSQKYESEFTRPMDMEAFLVRCDAEGRFTTTEVPMGRTLLVARAVAEAGIAVTNVVVRPESDNRVEVVLQRGATVHGRVVDGDGVGYAGLRVAAEWQGTIEVGTFEHDIGHLVSDRHAVTDGEGRFELSALLAGEHRLVVGAAVDPELRLDDDSALHSERVVLASEEALHWQAVVTRRQPLRVSVSGPDGAPLAGVAVNASGGEAPTSERALRRQRSGTDGVVTLDVEPGECVVTAHGTMADGSPDPLPARIERVAAGSGAVDLRLEHLPSAVLAGRLTGDLGSRAWLRLRRTDWPAGRIRGLDRTTGEFAFERLPAATYRLALRRVGDDGWRDLREVTLRPGERLALGILPISSGSR